MRPSGSRVAEDFCFPVTQRRALSTLDVNAEEDAWRWLTIAKLSPNVPARSMSAARARPRPIGKPPVDERAQRFDREASVEDQWAPSGLRPGRFGERYRNPPSTRGWQDGAVCRLIKPARRLSFGRWW